MILPARVAIVASKVLAQADYTIANRISDDVASIVEWAFQHDQPWLAHNAIQTLQFFDNAGSWLIAFVVYIVTHSR